MTALSAFYLSMLVQAKNKDFHYEYFEMENRLG